MINVFKYYEFSDFFKDTSGTFSGNDICFTTLNSQHFLIFEKLDETYNLYVSKYKDKKEVGFLPPEIVELLVKDYDKSVPAHRVAIKKYLF